MFQGGAALESSCLAAKWISLIYDRLSQMRHLLRFQVKRVAQVTAICQFPDEAADMIKMIWEILQMTSAAPDVPIYQ